MKTVKKYLSLALILTLALTILSANSLPVYASETQEPVYVLATDEDFAGEADGEFRYIGTASHVRIPHIIKGVPYATLSNMFKGSAVTSIDLSSLRLDSYHYDSSLT